MNIYEKLLNIQTELKAPKGQYNSFGKYKYRSCEDILEAVKPICAKNKATLILSDSLENIGDRYYIKATATLIDVENGENLENTAYAREEQEKKGMDGSQITGTASSYARKYALNGLFNIDDTKDADTDEYTKQSKAIDEDVKNEFQVDEKVTELEAKTIYGLIMNQKRDLNKFLDYFKIKNTNELTKSQYVEALKMLKGE
jgi:hypothetical protein